MNTSLAWCVALLVAPPVFADQFVVELDAELAAPPEGLMSSHGVTLDETLSAGPDSYAVFTAEDAGMLSQFLAAAAIEPEKVSRVMFVNSPVIGGGAPARDAVREGHDVFVIERPIPGVGTFGMERWRAISAGSNAAIAELGDAIEWDHSYLTDEGTYCIYRADSRDTVRKHGDLAGAPISRITAVSQRAH
ncbi:hypothetical protein ROJ8625_02209 [Roseivivax jejudonensis]|uniref:DUF4242 domain-containing protein n=1 Tax=Roseivivax jejudonensis TaxID=1529041 RepID=A0A1X6ZCP9_9RHOB|nr:DUF4242 domain-containing protein [Roseivivax jejudonensis]SLN45867.1 hypothetical protein ROJ8625_02209 [Roseivivax jejudonensis]